MGDICAAERFTVDSGEPKTHRFCLRKSMNPHWRELCSGLNDTETFVMQCCTEDNCNRDLEPRLDSEEEVPTKIPLFRPINETQNLGEFQLHVLCLV